MKHLQLTIVLVMLVSISGCGGGTYLTVKTNPDGAVIREMGTGVEHNAPARLFYDWEKSARGGCLRARGFRALWVSGASASTEEAVTMCSGPGEYTITINRPAGEPGLDADMEYLLRKRQIELTNRQIQNERDEAFSRGLEKLRNIYDPQEEDDDNSYSGPQIPRQINCTSRYRRSMSGLTRDTITTECR